jgi:hypothetical protein
MNAYEPTCQKYSAAASGTEAGGKDPDAAAQPMRGGTAPTRAPTHVLAMLTTLSGVYTAAYKNIFPVPRTVAISFVCPNNMQCRLEALMCWRLSVPTTCNADLKH